jgi:hypothetical protein
MGQIRNQTVAARAFDAQTAVERLIEEMMTPKWRRPIVIPFNIEKVIEP